MCNREKNWTISDSKDAIAEWWTEDDLHRHKNHSYGTVGWAIPSASGSASRSTNQRRDGTSSLWCWSERETNQAWLLVLVGWVTPTASFTTHCTDAKTASSEQWKRTEGTRHDRCSTMTTILILDWVIVSEQWMLFSIHRPLSLPGLSHRRLRQWTKNVPVQKVGRRGTPFQAANQRLSLMVATRDTSFYRMPYGLTSKQNSAQTTSHHES